MKKILSWVAACCLFVTCWMTVAPPAASAASFSGHYSRSGGFSSSRSSHAWKLGPSQSGSYRSGYKAPSSRVNRSGFGGSMNRGYAPRFGLGGHLFSFGMGWLFGSLFHPFGGYFGYGGGYGYHAFSLFRLLIDIFLILVIIWLIRRIFRR